MDCNIFSITKYQFSHIFNDKKFDLPIRWDGRDFKECLQKLFEEYVKNIKIVLPNQYEIFYRNIENVCNKIIEIIDQYTKGYTFIANEIFYDLFKFYMAVADFKNYQ